MSTAVDSPSQPPRPLRTRANGTGGTPTDTDLLEQVRGGDIAAYGQLYAEHVIAAYNLAGQLTCSRSDADDLVQAAFEKVLGAVKAGRQIRAFRAYLLTVLRRIAYDRTRRQRRLEISDDLEARLGELLGKRAELTVPFEDLAVTELEQVWVTHAFARLDERWQRVLWHVEVEGMAPSEVAGMFGMSPNGVSALAYRARRGLRAAFLEVQASYHDRRRRCEVSSQLVDWVFERLRAADLAAFENHLDRCEQCRMWATDLAEARQELQLEPVSAAA
ncbi:RNA polymerase sigma factor [Kutzneria buriramensis]|uniref:RNA polymerase sigma factor (Sigma-70 family) n=1 Tax=Kutzneria buriramensis TaxID=1045776 RepID=A0A3E0GVR9_9PSEU|nr:sigma-70 family RNA polymerase sigma factor [Kutzneria buriramensis]REH30979.1 RNA polymerase sigma factor (sigma-70 family) [Kutzneria buriramensis]